MKPARKPSALCSALLTAAIALCVSGCVTHRHAARPVSATLSIEVNGQWKVVQKTEYRYVTDNLATMPIEDLKTLVRTAEAEAKTEGDWQRASTLRNVLEMRQAGIPIKEE
jgi:hypothetical protein